MAEVRQRLSVGKSVQFTEKEAEEVQKIADQLNTSFAEIVRVCVNSELPKMKERIRKRKK
ncbi:MAG: hypothetical protein OXI24_16575 [Candidatus Poribacteria bacterium]|nr:hypothetical protein [Candidatus Poribacteria bacterium]